MKNRVWLVGVAIVVTAVLLLFVFGGDTKERISEDAGKEGGLEERSEETVRENNSNIEDEEQEELSAEEQAWKERVDAALAPVPCISVQGPTYAEEYYTGKLIDAHYHIADIPDSDPLGNQEEEQESDEPLLE